MRICKERGCDKPLLARGWCGMHYRRWTTHGDPNYVKYEYGYLKRISSETGIPYHTLRSRQRRGKDLFRYEASPRLGRKRQGKPKAKSRATIAENISELMRGWSSTRGLREYHEERRESSQIS